MRGIGWKHSEETKRKISEGNKRVRASRKVRNLTGVYALVNIQDGKMYIGGSVRIAGRLSEHLKWLNSGIHYNKGLQDAHDKWGIGFTLLEECNRDELKEREQWWLDNTVSKYNIAPYARGGNGPRSEDSKRRIGEAQRGRRRVVSAETREKISKAKKGMKFSEETIKRMSLG